MPKRATAIVLSEKEQEGLLQITKRHRSEQQVVLRARIVLAAAQGHANVQIARELDINVDTVRLWRDRWAGLQGIDLETWSLLGRLQYAQAPERAKGGERSISMDELTGVQAIERKHPDLPMQPGHVLRREFEYIRHGTLSWFINFDVVTGHVIEPS